MASKPASNKASTETRDYEVLDNLNHDGDAYAIGDTVKLSAAQAAPLLGSVVKLKAEQAGEAPAQP